MSHPTFSRPPALRRLLLLAALILCCGVVPGYSSAKVGLIRINGSIGPITVSYVQRAIRHATYERHEALIVLLDTPGGLLMSTKDIVLSFFSSPVPIVVFVAPNGATAASAGCFITLASEVAAMAPGTSIGAAHPVGGGSKSDPVMKQKLENFAATFIETIASQRNRNTAWAIASVRESAAITAQSALRMQVIDLIVDDVPDLLAKLDGRVVNGKPLHTADARLQEIEMSLFEKVFLRVWTPEVMYLLMLIVIFGIIGTLARPGAILPAVAGGISLILALFMASVLPINVTGLALIGLAICLFLADIFAPTHGVLTVGGVISFLIGSMILFDTSESVFRLSLALIIPATMVTAVFFGLVFSAGLRAQFQPSKTGREALVGKTAMALTPIGPYGGKVFIEGEYWNAVSEIMVAKASAVEIVAVRGLTLKIKPKYLE
jgi:membrane-bound serine protease (ClpP class)